MKPFFLIALAAAQLGGASPATKHRDFLIREVRFVWGADAEVSTFAAQIRQESAWREDATSSHAAGLAQFTPATAEWMTRAFPELSGGRGFSPDVMFDGKWSIRAMVRYDQYLYERLSPRLPERMALALRSYNGGQGWIFRELRECARMDMVCCRRFRSAASCRENVSYPLQILEKWKPLYMGWDR